MENSSSYIIAVLFIQLCCSSAVNEDDCTSGFPSVDRIDATLRNFNIYRPELYTFNYRDGYYVWVIIPSLNFTCHGNITSLTYGAQQEISDDESSITLHLLRINEADPRYYISVNNVTITAEKTESQFYQINLSPPLAFQPGDIIGYYRQSSSRMKFLFEYVQFSRSLYYYYVNYSQQQVTYYNYHALLSISTDPPGCDSGFMSVERIRLLLGLDKTGNVTDLSQRQMITPSMQFTCDGTVTKWILGIRAYYNYLENLQLQIWRKCGQYTYCKVNETLISFGAIQYYGHNIIFEHPTQIQVMAGDILGVSVPEYRSFIGAESDHGFLSYYVSTENLVSLLDEVNITQHVSSGSYRPLVAVEIIKKPSTHSPSSTSITKTSKTSPDLSSTSLPFSTSTSPSTSTSSSSGGVIGAVVVTILVIVLLATGVILFVIVWRKKRKAKPSVPPTNTRIHLNNPIYEGTSVTNNTSSHTQQSDDTRPCGEYSLVGHSESDDETRIFDNPLYSDVGPVTNQEDTTNCTPPSRELVQTTMSFPNTIYYVPNELQRQRQQTDQNEGDDTDNYSAVEQDQDKNVYWAPASTVTGIYEQLSHHKYREIFRKNIQMGESVGSGKFGVVNRGKWQDTITEVSMDVAIKTLRPTATEMDKVKFLQEAAINGQFKHTNIVQLYGVVTVGEPVMIVLEYLPNGDLRTFLQSLMNQCDPPQQSDLAKLCLSFSQQIASGMAYLAGKAFVHRDLAARNILVSHNRVCKVADFGMTRDLDEGSYYVSHGGQIPVKWTAPEALHYKKYSTASDVWSFGCVLYEIWSLGHKPFEGYTNSQALELVQKRRRLAPPPGCPRKIYSVMMNCWHPDKSSRPSFLAICDDLNDDDSLLVIDVTNEENNCHPEANILGGPLEAGQFLYTDLQNKY